MSNAIINGGASPYPKHVGPAAICSFNDGAQDAPLKSLKFYIEPSQSGSGDPSPSNIRPISGWTQVDAWQSGANLYDDSAKQTGQALNTNNGGTYANANWSTSDYIPIKPGNVNFAWNSVSSFFQVNMCAYDSSKTFIPESTVTYSASNTYSHTYSVVAGAAYVRFSWSTVVSSQDAGRSNIRVNFGSSDQGYLPFTTLTPITISLGQTVYGGTVDALNGKLVIDRILGSIALSGVSFTNGTNTKYATVTVFAENVLGGSYGASNPNYISNMIATYAYNTGDTVHWYAVNNSKQVRISVPKELDVSALTFQCVAELDTHIEVDLTPVSVNSLLGQNNVWASTGDTELDYYPAAASVVAVLNKLSKVYTSIPLGKIRYDTYQTTPNQALDLDSYRAETGVLIRNVLSHTATKIEFNTPSMTNLQWEEVWNIIKAGFNNSTERKLKLKYYDQMSATYKTGWFYVPDVQFTIRNIDEANGIINYDEVRVAFIEY